MKIVVNGEDYQHQGGTRLLDLLLSLGAVPAQVAVMLNDEIVGAGARDSCTVAEGDRVEILTLAAGGEQGV